ncbi:CocE/NonD family hydrolase [Xanthobacter sp. AM11]|uniref:CocE/NonD family hydrolase n=1 Tax=Xanthobacter sp. AM11 TaxID=3380643 RepID=UPI0039BF9EC3
MKDEIVDSHESIDIAFRQSASLSEPRVRYQGFNPHEKVLKAGTVMREGARALTCDILFQRDVPVQLRDGVTIYTDVLRPVDAHNIPAIIAWSPYGKNVGNQHLDDFPFRMGVALGAVSELNKWEAPDPAVWCARGYAVINPDARGTYTSDGDAHCWSAQEGRDGADLVDWAGTQSWCNGKVGCAGNSWLAAAQWFIAAERPRHLAAIAPWEGLDDVYRNVVCMGGIPDPGFMDWLIELTAGRNQIEDIVEMLARYPLFNAYWEEHAAKIEEIAVPAYVVGSWSNLLHCQGTFDAYDRLRSPKWLRVHDLQEWPDFYDPQNDADLARFFDYYLKGTDNGWDATPRVRMPIYTVGPDNITLLNRAEAAFPLARTRNLKLHLDAASRGLQATHPAASSQVEYSAVEGERVVFAYHVEETLEWVGFSELVLWVEAKDADDLDIYVRIKKLGADGEPFCAPNLPLDAPHLRQNRGEIEMLTHTPFRNIIFYEGPWGRLRASHRALDEARSTVGRPVHHHRSRAPLAPGEVVQVRIPLTPTGMQLQRGETLEVIVETENTLRLPLGNLSTQSIRAGANVIHTGGPYESYLLIPRVDQSSRPDRMG